MLYLLRYFQDRTEISKIYKNSEISSALIKFHSEYNDHIWHYPIVWIAGNMGDLNNLFTEIDLEGCILISPFKIDPKENQEFQHKSSFAEFIMGIKNRYTGDRNILTNVDHLTEDMAQKSLQLSGYMGTERNYGLMVQREKKFIRERDCYGVMNANDLVSRGAIMSKTDQYSSIGAFFTREDQRGKGFATMIINKMLDEAAKYSSNSCLFVNSENSSAISLYSRIGFKIIGEAYFTDFGTGLKP